MRCVEGRPEGARATKNNRNVREFPKKKLVYCDGKENYPDVVHGSHCKKYYPFKSPSRCPTEVE